MSASDSVSLYLAFPKILVAGFGSFFRATLVNRESTTLENVAVTFACADFDPPEIVLDFDAVAPGARVDKTISITPARPGSRPLACAVEFSLGSDSKSLFGSWEHLTIFEKPSNEINITNIVRDVQSHRSSGEKAEFGAVKGDVSINLTNNLTQIRTLNELLAANMPDELHQVHLRSLTTTEFSSSSNRRRIPSAFLRVYEPMAALSLRPLGAPPPDPRAPAVCGWRLRGGGTPLVLGRSSVDVDMVTRFMPADAANDSKSAGLSRRQARLSVNGSGQVQVENVSSGNVVIAGRMAVPVAAMALLPPEQNLGLGTPPADLRLGVRLAPAPHHSIRLMNLAEWQGYGSSRHLTSDSEPTWGHALFDWQNSAPSYWNTVWFSRLAAFGSAEDVPLRLDDPGIDPCHGFLHYFNGCYWLEVISPRGGVTLHDPQIPLASPPLPIPPGVIVPLRGNMTLTVGSTSYLLTKAA
jgi:hypothetical protein